VRPYRDQIRLACAELVTASREGRPHRIRTAISYPGYSKHGYGKAVDVTLVYLDTGEPVWPGGFSGIWKAKRDQLELLAHGLIEVGGFSGRLINEPWHFETIKTNNVRADCRGYPGLGGCIRHSDEKIMLAAAR
ncbi:hypothetical protein ACFLZY_03475, partial [Patescibacteria group bacterium]